MITEEQYQQAIQQEKEARELINNYHRQKEDALQQRLNNGTPFTDDELFYSARSLCPCGHGLAYPKGCGPFHYWDCSAILKGIDDPTVTHTAQLPFSLYDIKGESEHRGTTRGTFKPQPICGQRVPG